MRFVALSYSILGNETYHLATNLYQFCFNFCVARQLGLPRRGSTTAVAELDLSLMGEALRQREGSVQETPDCIRGVFCCLYVATQRDGKVMAFERILAAAVTSKWGGSCDHAPGFSAIRGYSVALLV
jgi:hypothetical protein